MPSSPGRLDRGQEVFWSTRGMDGLAFPPEKMVRGIEDYCRKKGLRLEIDDER